MRQISAFWNILSLQPVYRELPSLLNSHRGFAYFWVDQRSSLQVVSEYKVPWTLTAMDTGSPDNNSTTPCTIGWLHPLCSYILARQLSWDTGSPGILLLGTNSLFSSVDLSPVHPIPHYSNELSGLPCAEASLPSPDHLPWSQISTTYPSDTKCVCPISVASSDWSIDHDEFGQRIALGLDLPRILCALSASFEPLPKLVVGFILV